MTSPRFWTWVERAGRLKPNTTGEYLEHEYVAMNVTGGEEIRASGVGIAVTPPVAQGRHRPVDWTQTPVGLGWGFLLGR